MRDDEVLVLLVRAICEIKPDLEGRVIQGCDSMAELGVNSMERAEIIMSVLDELNLNIPLIETFGPKNLGELSALLAARCNGA